MTHPIPDAALDDAPTAASFWADDPATLAAFWDGFFAGRGAAHLTLAQLRNVVTVVTRALEVAEGQVEPAGTPRRRRVRR